MLIKLSSNSLISVLNNIKHSVPTNPIRPEYNNVNISSDQDHIFFYTFDGETSIVSKIQNDSKELFSFAIPFKPLISLISNFNNNVIFDITHKNDTLEISSGSKIYKFRTFPILVKFSNDDNFTNNVLIKEIDRIANVSKLSSVKENKESAVVQVVSNGSRIFFNSTDQYRLTQVEVESKIITSFNIIFHLSALDRASKIGAHSIDYRQENKSILLANSTAALTTRESNKNFPDVNNILDNQPVNSIIFKGEEIRESLKRLDSLSDDIIIAVEISEEEISLKYINSEIGQGIEKIKITNNDNLKYNFSVRLKYFLDAVLYAESNSIILKFGKPNEPIFLIWQDSIKVTNAVMPVM